MVDQYGDCQPKDINSKALAKRPTLHLAFPLVRLLQIEEAEVIVRSLDCPESDKQS